MFSIPENTLVQAALVIMIVFFATVSAVTGVEGHPSPFRVQHAVGAVAAVRALQRQDPVSAQHAGAQRRRLFSDFISLSMNTYAFDPPTAWLNGWTIFFWAWWIAWGPFVGLFLARISRGHHS